MRDRQGVIAGGNWILDRVKILDCWPQQDALANILSQRDSNGGAAFNVLVDLARLGAKFSLEGVGLVGDDGDGRWILAHCQQLGISAEQLHLRADVATSFTDVMTVEKGGRRTFFHRRGANSLLGPEHFTFTRTSAKIFHLGYLLLLDRLDQVDANGQSGAAQVLAAARTEGLWTSVDVVSEDSNRFAPILRACLPQVDVCFLNEFEAERSTGVCLRQGDTLLRGRLPEATQKLLGLGVRQAVVVHFPEGAYLRTSSGAVFKQGSVRLPVDQIQGAAGAGDAFASGFLLGWHEGAAWEDSLRLAVSAAAACLTQADCSGGIRPREMCLALGQTYGYRTWDE